MRGLLTLILLAALGWSGYWFFSAGMAQRAFQGWFDGRTERGWHVEYESLRINGFPNRFDTNLRGFLLENPHAGWVWQGEHFQLLSLAWKPHHLIAVWPGEQVISTRNDVIRAEADLLRGSVVLSPGSDLQLERLRVETEALSLGAGSGWAADMGYGYLAMERETDNARRYRIGLSLSDLTPQLTWNGPPPLPDNIGRISLDAMIDYDAPWDLQSLEIALPRARHIDITSATLGWGELRVDARGGLDVSVSGQLSGEVELTIHNVRLAIAFLRQTGVLPRNLSGQIIATLSNLAARRNVLTVRLRFENGRSFLGPLALGEAPTLGRR